MLRITGGRAKGITLQVLDKTTRPLTDRIKISLFDTLSPILENSIVLDLYAGSGAFGLEAVSRGASRAVLIEENYKATTLITNNIKKAGFEKEIEIITAKAESYLGRNKILFDIIFLDPPFPLSREKKLYILKKSITSLKSTGVIIFRYPKQEKYPALIKTPGKSLTLETKKKYGISVVNFYTFS